MGKLLAIAGLYAIGSIGFGIIQAVHNRTYGMDDKHAACVWWIMLAWYPIMVWVLICDAAKGFKGERA